MSDKDIIWDDEIIWDDKQNVQPPQTEQPQQNVLQQLMQAFAQTGQGMVRGAIEPPLKSLIARPMQSLESAVSGKPPIEYNYPFPDFLGGPINVKPLEGYLQGAGEAMQTGSMVLPGGSALKTAGLGAMYGAGQAMAEKEGPVSVAGKALLGGVIGGVGGKVAGQPLIKRTQKELDMKLRSEVEKSLSKIGVKPVPSEAPTATKVKGFFDKANDAIKIIYQAKDNLKYVDENGVTSSGLPKNTKEFAQAIEQTKKMVYDAYNTVAEQTTGQGVRISLANIADDVLESTLKPEITDLHPEIQEYALKLSETLAKRGSYTPKEAQAFIKTANETLKNYYTTKHPDYVSKAYVEAVAADGIRKSLDKSIQESTGVQYQALKNQYGALSTIEKQVNRASVVSHAKKLGLLDYFEIYNIGDITTSILTGNLPGAAMGVGRVAVTEGVKRARSSEFITKDLFKKVSGVENYKRVNEARSVLQGIIGLTKNKSTQTH